MLNANSNLHRNYNSSNHSQAPGMKIQNGAFLDFFLLDLRCGRWELERLVKLLERRGSYKRYVSQLQSNLGNLVRVPNSLRDSGCLGGSCRVDIRHGK